MLKFCKHCNKDVEVNKDESLKCGHRLTSINTEGFYLSNPSQSPNMIVDLKPGQILLNRFTIESLLGQGSSGSVYLASDNMRPEKVATFMMALRGLSAPEPTRHAQQSRVRLRYRNYMQHEHRPDATPQPDHQNEQ